MASSPLPTVRSVPGRERQYQRGSARCAPSCWAQWPASRPSVYVRASEILMGPFFVVLMGISQVAVPEASRVFHRTSGHLARFCFLLGSAQAAAVVAWGLILLTVFPLGPGPALLKELWVPTAQLIPAMTLTLAATSFVTAATAGLRAMGLARRSLRAQLMGSAAYAIGGAGGAILGGALGHELGCDGCAMLRRAGVVASASLGTGGAPRRGRRWPGESHWAGTPPHTWAACLQRRAFPRCVPGRPPCADLHRLRTDHLRQWFYRSYPCNRQQYAIG